MNRSRVAVATAVGLFTAAALAGPLTSPANASSPAASSSCQTFQCGVTDGYQAGYWEGQESVDCIIRRNFGHSSRSGGSQADYERGYTEGFNRGFQTGCNDNSHDS